MVYPVHTYQSFCDLVNQSSLKLTQLKRKKSFNMDHYPETLCLKIAILGLTKMRERHEKRRWQDGGKPFSFAVIWAWINQENTRQHCWKKTKTLGKCSPRFFNLKSILLVIFAIIELLVLGWQGITSFHKSIIFLLIRNEQTSISA